MISNITLQGKLTLQSNTLKVNIAKQHTQTSVPSSHGLEYTPTLTGCGVDRSSLGRGPMRQTLGILGSNGEGYSAIAIPTVAISKYKVTLSVSHCTPD